MRKFIVFFFVILLLFSLCINCFAASFDIVLPDMQVIPYMDIPLGSYRYTITMNGQTASGVSTLYFGDVSLDGLSIPGYYMPMTIERIPFVFFGLVHEDLLYLGMMVDGQEIPLVDGDKLYLSFEQIINDSLEDSIKDGISNVISYVQSVVIYITSSPIFSVFIIGLCVSLLFLAIKFIKVF